jgi:hypothetical protein
MPEPSNSVALRACLVVLLLRAVVGCEAGAEPKTNTKPKVDAKESFETLVQLMETNLSEIYEGVPNIKRSKVSYNVTKTTSIIRPFEGIMTYSIILEKPEARRPPPPFACKITRHFHIQDGRWRSLEQLHKTEITSPEGVSPVLEIQTKSQIEDWLINEVAAPYLAMSDEAYNRFMIRSGIEKELAGIQPL